MNPKITLALASASLLTAFTFSSCTKNLQTDPSRSSSISQLSTTTSFSLASGEDRLDSIVKGLSIDSYSLSFDQTYPEAGIRRTAYGTDNYYFIADSKQTMVTAPAGIQFEKVVFWKKPTIIPRTCPDMIIDKIKMQQVLDLTRKVNPALFADMMPINLPEAGTFLATKTMIKSRFGSLKADRIDAITKEFSPAKFVLLSDVDANNGGVFTRDSYGYADLSSIVMKPYKINFKDLIKPTLKGCFDPEIMKLLKEKLAAVNPAMYKGLTVTPLAANKNIATLSF